MSVPLVREVQYGTPRTLYLSIKTIKTLAMYQIAALYKFSPVQDPTVLRSKLFDACSRREICGTLLVAREGVNGTVAGSAENIESLLKAIKSISGFEDIDYKLSGSTEKPFKKLKVRLKKEIVTMGQPDVNPLNSVGTYVEPEDWNELLSQDDVVVIDTRNDYEVAIGTFEGAINPRTKSFREFPDWWEENKDRFKNQRVAMFCTGGIRCEKSTSYLASQGVSDVFHLKGGILKYLEKVPEQTSKWNGHCFVFDGRVSVGHGLQIGDHSLCYGCRRPIEPEDVKRPEYEAGVSCHMCISETTKEDKERFRERQKQLMLERNKTAI